MANDDLLLPDAISENALPGPLVDNGHLIRWGWAIPRLSSLPIVPAVDPARPLFVQMPFDRRRYPEPRGLVADNVSPWLPVVSVLRSTRQRKVHRLWQ